MPWVGQHCVIVVFPHHTRSISSMCFDNNRLYGEDLTNIHIIIHCLLFAVGVLFGSCFVMQYSLTFRFV